MRVAALIFGFLAGIAGIAVVTLGGLLPALAGNVLLGASPELTAQAVLLALPALCLFGAGLAIGAPRLAGLFLLLAAIGWAAVAWLAAASSSSPPTRHASTLTAFMFAWASSRATKGSSCSYST